MSHPSKQLSPSYQIIIVAGIIILFLQLYSHALSMFNETQTDAQIDRFEANNLRIKQEMMDNILESVALDQDSINFRRGKLEMTSGEGINTLPGERVFLMPESNLIALEGEAQRDKNLYQSPAEAAEGEELRRMKNRPVMEQWAYALFHIN